MASPFATLLRREWMQHRRGYLVMMALPPLLLLAALAFVPGKQVSPSTPALAFFLVTVAVTALMMVVSWIGMAFFVPGLARRDQQDRSLEFWASLPVSHSAGVGAIVLVHGVLMPILVMLAGLAAGLVVATATVIGVHGWAGLAQVPWGLMLSDVGVAALRLGAGLVLAALWLGPFLLLPMLGVALFKRWGVPLVVAGVVLGAALLDRLYGITIVGDTVVGLTQHAGNALFSLFTHDNDPHLGPHGEGLTELLAGVPADAAQGFVRALRDLASPLLVFSLALSAACFAGLVQLRRRAAG